MPKSRKSGRSPFVLIALLFFWSIIAGWGLAQAHQLPLSRFPHLADSTLNSSRPLESSPTTISLEPLSPSLELGRQYYFENCTSCHVALPPIVLPTETWRELLLDSQHYGVTLNLPRGPVLKAIWMFLNQGSRAYGEDETIPFRIAQSRFFKAFHPKVNFTSPPTASSCINCHIGTKEFDYQRLSSEWENSP